MESKHRWSFSRIGGFDQALLRTADDLVNLPSLDPKLWAALACPVKGLQFDAKTLAFIDVDGDDRVRLPEILAAVEWALGCLKSPELLLDPEPGFALEDLNTESPSGAELLSSAKILLSLLNKSDEKRFTLSDINVQQQTLKDAPLNGDGIILPGSTKDKNLVTIIEAIIKAYPHVLDVSGNPGVSSDNANKFFADCKARIDWLDQGNDIAIIEGVNTNSGFNAISAIRAKIDDYFSRSLACRFDPKASSLLNPTEGDWQSLTTRVLSSAGTEMSSLPLAAVSAKTVLPLVDGLNPAWQSAVTDFHEKVVMPTLGSRDQLTHDEWLLIKSQWDACAAWHSREAGISVAGFSREQLAEMSDEPVIADIHALIASDAALEPQVKAFSRLEQLVLFRLHLKELLNNFVNFTNFYSVDTRAVFEAGTLFLDGRACELCIEVIDPSKHAALAGLSKCFLAYCDITRPNGAKKAIVAAFTNGDPDYLLVGRNGVFYDRAGNDWDATITKLIENPISIRQAFFSPYKRLIRFVEEQAAKSAAAAETASQTKLQGVTVDTAAGKAPGKPKLDLSIIAAMGVAVGGVATAVGMLLQAVFGLGYMMPLGILGFMVLISGPSVFIAWLKLRQRNLGPLLDASGWAVNGQIKINAAFGGKLTALPRLPKGAKRNLVDPYADESTPWGKWLLVLLVVIGLGAAYLWYNDRLPWLTNSAAQSAPEASATPEN
jgi:hypothetical protein